MTTDRASFSRQKNETEIPTTQNGTFGFVRHTSPPFTKPKELKFSKARLKMCKTFYGLFMSI
ncbi:MAG: hypothetical protein ACK42Z_03760 [Candidatus Kapaibacteriota bacterium]